MTLIKVRNAGIKHQFVLLEEDAWSVGEDDEVYLVIISNGGHDVSIESFGFETLARAHA